MVNAPALILVLIAAVAFLAFDGVKKVSEFIDITKRGSPIIVPRKTDLADSAVTEVRTEEKEGGELLIASVTSRGGKQTARPSGITTTQKPKPNVVLSAGQSAAIAGKSNISTGEVVTLTSKEISDLRNKPFTAQEQADAQALTARLNRKTPAQQKLKSSPVETIFQKREQELISKKVIGTSNFFGGKLFANPDFPLTAAEKRARGL